MLNNSLFDLPTSTVPDLNGGLAGYLGAMLFFIGGTAFAFLVPALAGYIAYAIADRPGIAPGFITGAVAVGVNAGFIGGLIGGVIAGLAALWMSRLKVRPVVRGLHAGRGHPAVRHPDRQRPHGARPRPSARRGDHAA